MDKKVEEIIKKKAQTPNADLRELFKQSKPNTGNSIEVKEDVVVRTDPSQFSECPIIEVTDEHYFHTIDGRTLVFKANQKSPYIFLPFPLRRALFHNSGKKTYFVTLDSSNKLQYSVFGNGYPSDERHVISRNVTQVIQQANRIFYISTKNGTQHVNTVHNDNGVLKGKICVPNIKGKSNLSIFHANSTLFLNIDSQLQREDEKKLPVQGDQICGIGSKFLVLESKKEGIKVFLLDEKYCLMDQLRIPTSGRTTALFPLGDIVGVRVDGVIYILGISGGKLEIEREIPMNVSPLALDLTLKDRTIRISKIIPGDAESSSSRGVTPTDSQILTEGISSVSLKPKDGSFSLFNGYLSNTTMNDTAATGTNDPSDNLGDLADVPECLSTLDFHPRGIPMKRNLSVGDFLNNHSFEPYSPDRGRGEEAGILARKVDAIFTMQHGMWERIVNTERTLNEKFAGLVETLSGLNESKIRSMIQETVRKEMLCVSGPLKNIESKLKDGALGESKILECVKKIVLGTVVPVVEASMDEMRIQVVNEMRLIHSEGHLKGVKRAVDSLHTSFNKQNEIKNLISQGLVEKAAEIALKSPEYNLEVFISNVEISCMEHLSSSILIALLEKVLVMTKDNFKPQYQSFLYMVMVCLELDDLSDDEIQVLEILMSYINTIEGLPLEDSKGLAAIIDFQKLKLSKVKNRKGIK